VFIFKKYIEGYKIGKHGVSSKYSLNIGSFLREEGQDPPEGSATYTAGVGASQNPPSRDATPLMSGLMLIALDTEHVADVSPIGVGETSPNTPSDNTVRLAMGLPLAVPDARQAIRIAVEEAALPASTSEAF